MAAGQNSQVNVTLRLLGGASERMAFGREDQLTALMAEAGKRFAQNIAYLVSADGEKMDSSRPLGDFVHGEEAEFVAIASMVFYAESDLVIWFDSLDRQSVDTNNHLMNSKGSVSASICVKPFGEADDPFPAYMRFEDIPKNPPGHDWRWERCLPLLNDVPAPVTCFVVLTPTDQATLDAQWQVFPMSFGGPSGCQERDVLQNVTEGGGVRFMAFQQSVGGGPAIELGDDFLKKRVLLQCDLTNTCPPHVRVMVNNDKTKVSTVQAVEGSVSIFVGNRLILHELMVYSRPLLPEHRESIITYLMQHWDLKF